MDTKFVTGSDSYRVQFSCRVCYEEQDCDWADGWGRFTLLKCEQSGTRLCIEREQERERERGRKSLVVKGKDSLWSQHNGAESYNALRCCEGWAWSELKWDDQRGFATRAERGVSHQETGTTSNLFTITFSEVTLYNMIDCSAFQTERVVWPLGVCLGRMNRFSSNFVYRKLIVPIVGRFRFFLCLFGIVWFSAGWVLWRCVCDAVLASSWQ